MPVKGRAYCISLMITVCNELAVPDHAHLDCKDEAGMTRCQLTCDERYDFDREPLPEYKCGINTGYEWNLLTEDNPKGRFPNCMGRQFDTNGHSV